MPETGRYNEGGHVDAPTELLIHPRARQAAKLSRMVATAGVERCANLMCENVVHQGKFVTLMAWIDGKPFAMSMCAPCAELMRQVMMQ